MSFKQDYHLNKIAYWNNYNRSYLAKREFDTITYLLKVFNNFELKKGFRVLDLGSGDKFLKNEFKKREILYFSLDIKDLDFEKDKFDFEDDKFDLVISLAVIEHLKNPDIFLSESRRVLKKGSFLFLSTPNWKYSSDIFYDDVTHVKPYTPESLTEILSIKNFKEINIMPNLRCKSKWWYESRFKFFFANYLALFSNNVKFIPKFFKGKSKGMFSISKKD